MKEDHLHGRRSSCIYKEVVAGVVGNMKTIVYQKMISKNNIHTVQSANEFYDLAGQLLHSTKTFYIREKEFEERPHKQNP